MNKSNDKFLEDRIKNVTKSLLMQGEYGNRPNPLIFNRNEPESTNDASVLRIGDVTFKNMESFTDCPCCKPCSHCGKTKEQVGRKSLFRCQKCKNSFYCSAECQREEWKKHKKKCVDVEKSNILKFHLFYNLGNCNFKHFKPKKCVEYYDCAIKLFKEKLRQEMIEHHRSMGLSHLHIFLSKCYLHKGKSLLTLSVKNVLVCEDEEEDAIDRGLFEESVSSLQASVGTLLENPMKSNNLHFVVEGLYDLSRLYYFDEDYKKSYFTLLEALGHSENIEKSNISSSLHSRIHIFNLLSSICIQNEDLWDKGIEYASLGLRTFDITDDDEEDSINEKTEFLGSEMYMKPYFYYYLGYIHFQMNELSKSYSCFRKGLDLVEEKRNTMLFGTFDGHLALILHLCLAIVLYFQEKYSLMILHFKKVQEYTGGMDQGGSKKRMKKEKKRKEKFFVYTASPVKSFEILKFVRSLMDLPKGKVEEKRREVVMKPLKFANYRLDRHSIWLK